MLWGQIRPHTPHIPSHSFGHRSSWPRSAAVDRSTSSSGTQDRCRYTSPRMLRSPVRNARSTSTASAHAAGSCSRIDRHMALLLANIAARDNMDRERQDVGRHQPCEMIVDGLWLPAGVRKMAQSGMGRISPCAAMRASVVDCTPAPRESARKRSGEGSTPSPMMFGACSITPPRRLVSYQAGGRADS